MAQQGPDGQGAAHQERYRLGKFPVEAESAAIINFPDHDFAQRRRYISPEHSDLDKNTPCACRLYGRSNARDMTGAFESNVEAAAFRDQTRQSFSLQTHIDDSCASGLQGDRKRCIDDVRYHDLRSGAMFSQHRDKQANRSRTSNKYALPGQGAGTRYCVQANGKGLGKSRIGQIHLFRQNEGLHFAADQNFPKATLGMWEVHRAAEKAHLLAVAGHIRNAGLTMAARCAGVDRDLVADRDADDTSTDLRDDACDLVPQNHRLLEHDAAVGAVLEIVKVRSTDPGVVDCHRYLCCPQANVGNEVDSKIVFAMKYDRAHLVLLASFHQRRFVADMPHAANMGGFRVTEIQPQRNWRPNR